MTVSEIEGAAGSAPADADYYRRQLHTVAQNATLALFIMDEHQRCTYMNPAAERMTGYRLDELQGKALHYYVHHTRPDGSPYPLEECPIDQAFPQNMREQGEEVFVHRDGHFYPVAFTASPILEDGRPVGTIIEARDVTEEKAREAEFRAQQERYRFLAETIPAQVWTAGPDGALDYVSARTARYFGVAPERLLREGWTDGVHPDDVPQVLERWTRSLRTGEPYEADFRLRNAAGEYRWHLARADAMRGGDGQVTCWFGVNTDVHDQKTAERDRDEALRAAEFERSRLATAFQAAPAFIATLRGPDHVFEMANPPYDQLVGHRPVRGRPVREALPEVVEQGFVELLDTVYRTGEPFVGTEARVLLQRESGGTLEERYVNFVYQPLSAPGGGVDGILVHGVDVTDQVEARQRVEEQAVELEAQKEELEVQKEELVLQAIRLEEMQVELELSNDELQAANDDLRRAGDETARERAHLAAIIDHAPVGILIAEAPGGRILLGNRRVEEIFRHPVLQSETVEAYGEWIGFHPDGRRVQAHEYPLGRVFATGEVAGPDDYLYQRGDGTRAWVRITGVPIRDARGELIRGLVVIDDIDTEKRAEEEREQLILELEVERARLSHIFAESPAVMALYSGPDHVISMVNPTWERTVGRPHAVGRPIREVFPELAGTGLLDQLDHVYQTGEPFGAQEVHVPLDRRGDGTLEDTYWNFVWRPLAGAGSAARDILVHAVEVTTQVQARMETEAKAEELSRLARALEASNQELDKFAYVASHDLKAPLRGISNLSSWIEEDLGDAAGGEVRQHLALMRGRVVRMEGLIEGILQYSRAGRTREATERVDTGALARDVWDLLAPPEGASIEIQPGMPALVTERLPLQQVLMNLVGNAVKYGGGESARVEVSALRTPGGVWEFAVRDHGPGIPPEYHDRIWGIFQTLEPRDRVESTGIGLSIVKKLVESRGGTVWVEAAPEGGAVFRFRWPAEQEGTGA